VQRASCVIIVTADANRNLYQAGFAKHIATMCSMFSAMGQKKSLMVVAVSSPYDLALDKTIGTYVCTFDFTETAMRSLVHALFGAFSPQGSLPGTLRKTKKVVKSRQHWLVEPYKRDRDGRGLDELIEAIARGSAPHQPFLFSTRAATFELHNSGVAMEEQHFVVRNSSTGALYGFCATYFAKSIGYIAAVLVDPAKRNVSIGHSLHRRSLRSLVERPGIKKVQLGVSLPGVYLGIPADESSNLKSWFTSCGWDLSFPRRLTNLTIDKLANWIMPDGLLQAIQRANISFDLIHGLDNAESVLTHVSTHATPEIFETYKLALQETSTCGVVRAKSPVDNLLGTVIICSPSSPLRMFIPPLAERDGALVGGIIAPIVPATAQATLALQGLALMGVRQNKAHKAVRSVLSWVQDELSEPLLAMGFDVLQTFEEVTNLPENMGF
jgi:beta-N-acetylhexosaminidase